MPSTRPAISRRHVCASLLFASTLAPAAAAPPPASYLDRLRRFRSNLVLHGPAPQDFKPSTPPAGVREIVYPSGSLSLKAWVALPPGASPSSKVPGVVFFHGGFAFAAGDFDAARPFLDAGFALLCPMLRAENGNPGSFELLLGEIDDAKAAVAWLAQQPEVDASRLYTFGHSIGGVVSALLSLHPVGIRHGGSSGGLFGTRMFDADWMKPRIPFAGSNPDERELRVLVGNVPWMQHPHHAWVGEGDALQDGDLAAREPQSEPRLSVTRMAGDHFTSFGPSLAAYVDIVKADRS
ncbi:alpha/beta hydrolase family protein [Scleromatobacter humisilvae]|uniref:Prolyl oligopeptidase family serine peptidase n=1 Tax=Scleromatobacter humisilvae TaxID=2897159 RepID=A0A9X2C114_9BURK|nr:CocE/NonD family hydrolase [Scleromatobacter humisilvae]MCK9684485.1 prolyl oligopeptidase family serine peptidase [Scleromatobacter humisilvae]